ncbi:MAG: hypothetical protein K2X71_04155 [Methylobacterium sp.]|uniref:hypothetical protein n=1 Tax=Methylobacterium sp. TaxID=409 RepID=UPI0025876A15|nr:hypothetical protein [Methylobacterium sp.]MBY0295223.1 hypothetical protein [Methylobacterium sp.]
MRTRRVPSLTVPTILAAALLGAAPLSAQTADPGVPPSPRAGDPGSTGAVNRSITATGQTKPPGAAVGPRESQSGEQRDKIRDINRKVDTGICIGCN